jgi:glycosyltransferase involved in cell wall biosynthesis
VVFSSFRENIAPSYAALDVAVLPSEQEGFGRVLLEAAAFGLPSIGSRAGGIGEVIQDGATGWLFNPGDTVALLACLREAEADPGERTRRGQAALISAWERFSLASHVERVQAIYDELLANSDDLQAKDN